MSEEIIPEELEEVKETSKPIKLIIGLFILLILIFSFIPYYIMKLDPNPNYDKLNSIDVSGLIPDTRGHASSIASAPEKIDVGDYRVLAAKIAADSCTWESNVCYAKAQYYFVRDRIKYIPDPEKQYVQLPSETLISGAGDCEDRAILLATGLEAIGLDADIGLTHNHAFVRVQLPEALWRYKADEDYVYLDPRGENIFGEVNFNTDEIKSFVEL